MGRMSMWHPGACSVGPTGISLLQPSWHVRAILRCLGSARAGGPAAARVWALGCCTGPKSKFAGNILSEVTALSEPSWAGYAPVGGHRFRPSQWRLEPAPRSVGRQVRSVRVAPLRPVSGRLNSASSLVDPRPFPLRRVRSGPQGRCCDTGPLPGPGSVPRSGQRRPAESAGVAGLGRGRACGNVRRDLGQPAAGRRGPGD